MDKEKFVIETGNVMIEMLGITNYEDIKKLLGEKAANPICNNSADKKELEAILDDYTKIRKPIKVERASANKYGTAKVKEVLAQYDEITQLIDSYKAPILEVIETYTEKNRLENIERKSAIFAKQIVEINDIIKTLNQEFDYILHEEVIFLDEWGKKSEDAIKKELEKIVTDITNTRTNLLNKIKGVQNTCKMLKGDYDLKSDLDYKIILENDIYIKDLSELEEKLDKFAMNQQKIELDAEEAAEKEANRKAKITADKVAAEQKKKDEEADKKHQEELKATEDKVRAEEKAKQDKIEADRKERDLEEKAAELKRLRLLEEQEKKEEVIPVSQTGLIKDRDDTPKATRDYTLKFTVDKEQAQVLFQCLIDNEIKYEKV